MRDSWSTTPGCTHSSNFDVVWIAKHQGRLELCVDHARTLDYQRINMRYPLFEFTAVPRHERDMVERIWWILTASALGIIERCRQPPRLQQRLSHNDLVAALTAA